MINCGGWTFQLSTHSSFKEALAMLLWMKQLGGKGRHSWALLMRACDSHFVILTPTTPEGYGGGGGIGGGH